MSQNPNVQDRLVQELETVLSNVDASNVEQACDAIMNDVPYLDACVKESLRKYPPVPRLERRVGKPGYKLNGLELDKGLIIEMSAYAVHHDPRYYPNPNHYDPERFMPENRDKLVPNTYMPFGMGPRNCVGMRFAYQEIKLCLAQILTHFKITASASTPSKLTFKPNPLLLIPESIKVNVERRIKIKH